MNQKITLSLIVTCCISSATYPFVVTNFFRPYDQVINAPLNAKKNWQIGLFMEGGSTEHGRTADSEKANVLALQNPAQNVMSMLNNPTDTNTAQSTVTCMRNALIMAARVPDGGNISMMSFEGKFSGFQANLFGAYRLPIKASDMPGNISLKVFLPIVHKEIDHVRIQDLAVDEDFGGPLVVSLDKPLIDQIKNNLAQTVSAWGDGLCLDAWSKTGLGDLAVMVNWEHTMRQYKEHLKEVTLAAQVGVSCPTGSMRDENRAFSLPLGNDGAWGVPFGMGLDLGFIHNIHAGVNADFVALFDKTRMRRLKTDRRQTDFLLLNKGVATKEHGLSWQFHLYVGAHRFLNGFSAQMGYQFFKHDNDRLSANNNKFNFDVINTTPSLREMASHRLVFKCSYDHSVNGGASLFVCVPVGGKNVIDPLTIGAQLVLNF